MESEEDSAPIVDSVVDGILDLVMYMAVDDDPMETKDTLHDSGPWEDDDNVKEEAVVDEALQQEAVMDEAVKEEAVAQLGNVGQPRRSERLKLKFKRL